MRLLELRLNAFGPFTDFSLDLSGGQRGLHLIYGANEAGKSSTLRALKYLCFGFPGQLDDDFVHSYQNLRVGAKIRNDDGEELEFLRRKAKDKTLRGPDDVAVVEEAELQRFLGNVDRNRFGTFFAIDHQALVEGGRMIAEGKGDVGEILFTGTGIADLHAVQEQLKADAEELFKSRGAKPQINQWIKELGDVQRTVKECQLAPKEWEDHHRALQKTLKRKKQVEAELREKGREKNRLERIRQALPLIGERDDWLARRQEVREAVLLSEDFQKRRLEVQQTSEIARNDQRHAAEAICSLEGQIGELDVPQELLEQRELIEDLHSRLGVHRQALDDRPGLAANLEQLEEGVTAILAKLGCEPKLSQAETLELPETVRIRIRDLGNQYRALCEKSEFLNEKVEDLQVQITDSGRQLEALPAPCDSGPLQSALQATRKLGDIESQLAALRQDYVVATEQARIDLRKLPLWTGTDDVRQVCNLSLVEELEELEALPLPSEETIERFRADFSGVEENLRDWKRQLRERRQESEDLGRKLEELRLETGVPSEGFLQQARTLRDQGWKLIREAWQGKEPDTNASKAFVETVGGSDDLAQAYERSVKVADETSDRLRREADRVAINAQLQARLRECQQKISRIERESESAKAHRDQIAERWSQVWQPIGIQPLAPSEMLAWTRQQRGLAERIRNTRQLRASSEDTEARLDEHRKRLIELLAQLGQAPAKPTASLTELITTSELVLESTRKLTQKLLDLRRDRGAAEGQLQKALKQAASAQEQLQMWHEQWSAAIANLPLGSDARPSEANAVLESLSKLSQKVESSKGLHHRIREIDTYTSAFTRDVHQFTLHVAPDLADVPVEQTVGKLINRLTKTVAADEKRKLLTSKRDEENEKLEKARQTLEGMELRLSALCAEARCDSPDDFPQVEWRSQLRRKIDEEIARLEKSLMQLSAGATLEALLEEARSVDADGLEPQIEQLRLRTQELDCELRDEIGQTIGAEKKVLEQMDSSAKAADASEKAQDLLAKISSVAEEYARLKLAAVVLRNGIERYREAHQQPILRRASEFFRELTNHSFKGLRVDYSSDGKTELVGVRSADAKAVGLDPGMSDGTQDQLYFALRLAWLENYLCSHERIPFIVDDVLIRFDDERSEKTLDVLGQLSNRTQVLFFTHHRHLLDLAKRRLSSEILFTHELPANTQSIRAVGSM